MVKCYINDELIESVRFPITVAGTESTITMIVKNDLYEDVELIPYTNDPDVEIVEYPRNLRAGESAKTVWKFAPTKERLRSLSCECGFKEIIGN